MRKMGKQKGFRYQQDSGGNGGGNKSVPNQWEGGEPTPANENIHDMRDVLRTTVGGGGTNIGGGTGNDADIGKNNTIGQTVANNRTVGSQGNGAESKVAGIAGAGRMDENDTGIGGNIGTVGENAGSGASNRLGRNDLGQGVNQNMGNSSNRGDIGDGLGSTGGLNNNDFTGTSGEGNDTRSGT